MSDALIFSIHPEWVEKILSGAKQYELRRRPPKLSGPTAAFLYETSPASRLRVVCKVGPIISGTREEVWRQVGSLTGLNRHEFESYFRSRNIAYAIKIDEVREIPPWSLACLREQFRFVPPQAWCYAREELIRSIGAVR
ncbi:hypothetical protein IYW40_11100 [Methylocystis sp. H4A]|uniref:hypothetical protein n=1 Tax=Methylocystis sp. H4A TaxID=2785788 RepID=UPI0018C217D3|nr:hypothetical protein [Methylocystis sp. H4A]MBG0801482.1 hypothetical protein [Methylocystis sp. H4A]MBG0802020.1 hypothetical protein [Methylocystis sp. H4A]